MTPAELQTWRSQAGLSQPGLAALLGVDKQTIWRWEHAQRAIPPFLDLALVGLLRDAEAWEGAPREVGGT